MQDSPNNNAIGFMKMHGAGNDFVIIDSRRGESVVTTQLAALLGGRHFGVGFDQLAEITSDEDADVSLHFWNSDGKVAGACGNATRCVAKFLMEETEKSEISIRTVERTLLAEKHSDGQISVNMGQPLFDWQGIPLARDIDSRNLPISGSPDAVGFGNPHCVQFVDDLDDLDIAALGSEIETDPLFPDGTNVEFVKVLAHDRIRMRVWERGTGVTLACGSGACAAHVAAHRRGLIGSKCSIQADGGTLTLDWRDDGVWLAGPTTHVFDGVINPAILQSL